MTIKIHLVFSFLIHSLILTYFLSLPIYKSSIDTLSFEEYFVYLNSEEGQSTEKQSSAGKGKKSGLREQGNEKKDNETTLLAQQIDKEKITQQDLSSSKEHVIEIIKNGVIEHEVFKARDSFEEGKEIAEPLVGKQPDTEKEIPEDLKEGVIVYKGMDPKTMPGFTVIPYEEASGVEKLHAKRQEEKKETHDIEVLEKQKGPSFKEVKKEKIQEYVDVIGVRKDEMFEKERKETELVRKEVYKERGLLSKDLKVKVSSLDEKMEEDFGIQREATPGREVLKEEIAEAQAHIEEEAKAQTKAEVKVEVIPKTKAEEQKEKDTETKIKEGSDTDMHKVMHLAEKTQPKVLPEVDVGLLLETIPRTMTMPFKSEFTGETLHAEKRVFIEQKGEQELKRYEEEKEPVQDIFEVEESFDRLRVEEKLKYLESSVKEKNKKTKEKEIVTEEPQREMITKKISIPVEKSAEPAKPVVEIVKSSTEQASSETGQMEEEEEEFKTALTKEKAGDREEFKERGVKETALKTVDSKQTFDTVESKEDSFNDKERVSSTMKKIHQESETEGGKIQSESLIERIIDAPFTVKTDRLGELYQDDSKKEITEIEDRESVVEEVLTPEKNRIPSQEKNTVTSDKKKRQMTTEISHELQEEIGAEEKEPFLGISIPDVFLKKDIKIEISLNDPKTTQISFQLMKKSHPLDEKNESQNQKEIELVEDTYFDYASGYKRVFSTAKAEKGVYIFVIKNNDIKGYEADILFHIFEGKSGERRKEYKTIGLPPHTTLKYKFIIPETVFWDDEDYFTGTIESSNTLTKFNEKTGLIWKEKKDH